MDSEILNVPTVSDEVYKRIKNKIINGELRPGEKVTIRQIADTMGVSTMPVRESLKKLQVEGFVRYERRSVVISQLSIEEVEEIFKIRQRLEPLAIEWALPNIVEKDINLLRQIVMEMDENLEDKTAWERLNKKFHLNLYSYSNSHKLNQILTQVWGTVEPYMHIYLSSDSEYSLNSAQSDHYLMLDYIQNKQTENLIELTIKHLSNTCDDIVKKLK
ncbi:GntR family transcriptional regulator [Salibacterium aidingense]|uniref:GntR family transcriptional regulator n=1 Tax=Salibacterium aidingense TaxID=384933 RepID=UPI000419F987|nr:GntR family transcriptional regulator [Salibacterium aidingense]